MTVVKNTNSDYIINCKHGNGNVVINSNTQVFGYFGVSQDYMTIAYNNNGVINNMGMLAQTSLTTWAGLRFNQPANRWEVSSNVNSDGSPISDYAPIGSGADGTPGGPNLSVQFNSDGEFGGAGNFIYDYNINGLRLNGYQYYTEQTTPPTNLTNHVTLYGGASNIGGTGLYVNSGSVSEGELISANKALLYSIIF